jgi:hypothetical protein
MTLLVERHVDRIADAADTLPCFAIARLEIIRTPTFVKENVSNP